MSSTGSHAGSVKQAATKTAGVLLGRRIAMVTVRLTASVMAREFAVFPLPVAGCCC